MPKGKVGKAGPPKEAKERPGYKTVDGKESVSKTRASTQGKKG